MAANTAPANSRLPVVSFVAEVLVKRFSKEKAVQLAAILSDGRWDHDFPITVERAGQLGLPVSTTMPRTAYQLMDLYPQAATGRPSVLYVPLRRAAGDQGETPKSSPASPSSCCRRLDLSLESGWRCHRREQCLSSSKLRCYSRSRTFS
jgi:hypothetical protein